MLLLSKNLLKILTLSHPGVLDLGSIQDPELSTTGLSYLEGREGGWKEEGKEGGGERGGELNSMA